MGQKFPPQGNRAMQEVAEKHWYIKMEKDRISSSRDHRAEAMKKVAEKHFFAILSLWGTTTSGVIHLVQMLQVFFEKLQKNYIKVAPNLEKS